MKEILERLFLQDTLTRQEAHNILGQISDAKYDPIQVSAFLSAFRMRNITIEELAGFRDCLQERSIYVDLSDFDTIDLCGTGGDKKNTFNISTTASFVVAGAGYKVAKHGNYGVSSLCGSSNVMEYLGYKFTNDADVLRKQIDEANICFFHAPLFHPAMKEVAPIRRTLQISTFFNMLGPLVNPSRPQKQLVGVYSVELLRYYEHLLLDAGKEFCIVHTLDGYDEVSLTDKTKVSTPNQSYYLDPLVHFGRHLSPEALQKGDDIKSAARILTDVLNGKGTEEQNLVVTTNAALAIQRYHTEKSMEECREIAIESIESGNAYSKFKKAIEQ